NLIPSRSPSRTDGALSRVMFGMRKRLGRWSLSTTMGICVCLFREHDLEAVARTEGRVPGL
ncbi:hypothetical protein, partial [Amycolatopsis sp. NPDC054798]